MRAKGALTLLIISMTCICCNGAQIIYVDVNGPNDPGTGSFNDPFRKVQDAIDSAINEDIVEVREGIYTGPGNYDLDPGGKNITIRSTNPQDPNIVANTIIDPNRAGLGFYFHSGEDANCIVSGLTITNGNDVERGGGIYCTNSSPKIRNCVISGNSARLFGGGIQCEYGNPEIVGCTIMGNSAQDGGGVGCYLASPRLTNCIIIDNQASDTGGGGGGLEAEFCNNIDLTNCTLVGNAVAGSGGAVRCQGSKVAIKNCIVVGNDAAKGSQIALEWFISNPSSVSVNYSDVEGGQAGIYVYSGSILVWGSGNIDAEPNFAKFDPNGEPNLWDLHLQSAYGRWDPNSKIWVTDSNTSLCIDAGDPNSAWSSEPWPNGKRINMGAYGGMGQASMNGNAGDFNIDGVVNFEDFCELANKWGCEGSFIEDLVVDGIVNPADLRIFVENWLWQRE